MNEDKKIEQDLRRMGRSLMPNPTFADRVMRQIDTQMQPARSVFIQHWWLAAGAAIAASILIVVGWPRFGHVSSHVDPPQPTQLVKSSTQWQAVSERPVILAGEVPAREISRQLFDRVIWTDPQRHATFERIVPRQTVKLVTLENY